MDNQAFEQPPPPPYYESANTGGGGGAAASPPVGHPSQQQYQNGASAKPPPATWGPNPPPPPGWSPYPPSYGAVIREPIPMPVTQVILVGGCPACRVGVLEEDFSCLGVLCAIILSNWDSLLPCPQGQALLQLRSPILIFWRSLTMLQFRLPLSSLEKFETSIVLPNIKLLRTALVLLLLLRKFCFFFSCIAIY
jgi:hypothetical protein